MKRMLGWLLAGVLVTPIAYSDDWPQWRGAKRDGVWREAGLLEKFPAGGPKVLWRAEVGGGYAGPAVSGGRVFVIDRVSAKPGAQAGGGVERVVCFDERTGKPLWAHSYACAYTISYGNGPRATPVINGERVYTLGAQGHLKCLNIANGEVVWQRELAEEGTPGPVWGYAAHPLIDGDRIICLRAAKDGVVAAFDKNTGNPLWTALKVNDPGYAPATICEFAGSRQLVVWHPEAVNGLDPETGKLLWSQPFGPVKNNVSIVAPMQIGEQLFVSSFWDGAMMLRPAKESVEVVWKKAGTPPRKTAALHNLMSPPIFRDGYLYGVCAGGQLRCIDATNGDTAWETMAATTGDAPIANTTAFLTPSGDRMFIANDNGELIIARLTPKAYEEIDRAKILEPTQRDGKRKVLWCHPAYANKAMFWRNDKELVRVVLSAN